MDNPGEILRLCRLCLVKDQVNIPIFAEQGDSREIFLKISSCLPVKVSIEDRLPKKICDGCSEKLNSFYEFWSSSANAEKTLLSWLGEDEVEEKKVQAVPKSLTASATLVKEESAELVDEAHAESIEESTKDESEAPPTKRARRSAAVKAQINLAPDSEDDDLDTTEPLTKMEEESADSDGEEKDPSYTEMPGTSADDEQAGPSGMGKDGVEAPLTTKCADCAKVFKTAKILKAHRISMHIRPKQKFVCCGVAYVSEPKYQAHRTKYHTEQFDRLNGNQFYCKLCSKTLHSYQGMLDHLNVKHTKSTKYYCERCDASYHSLAILRNHLRNHDKVDQKKYQCIHCLKNYPTQKALDGHTIANHTEHYDKLDSGHYQCKHCTKVMVAKVSMEQHLNLVHLGGNPYVCSNCGKVCYSRSSLRKHETIHVNTKSYRCEECHSEYKNRDSLRKHQKLAHGDWNRVVLIVEGDDSDVDS